MHCKHRHIPEVPQNSRRHAQACGRLPLAQHFTGDVLHPDDSSSHTPTDDGIELLRSESAPPDQRNVRGGAIYCDGSASRHPAAGFRRAAWATVWVDEHGEGLPGITKPSC